MKLELMKKEVELKRVSLAKDEMLLRIQERLEEIERLKQQMVIQDEAVDRITKEIESLKGK